MGFTSSNSPLTPQWRYSQRVCTCRYSGFEGSVTLLRESLASRELRLRLKSLSSSLSSHQRHRFPFRTPPAACGWLCRRCWSSLSPLVQSSGRGGRRRVVWCGVVLTTLSVAHRPPEGGRPHPSRPDLLGVVTSNRNALSGAHECGGQLCHCAPRFRRPHDAGRRNAKSSVPSSGNFRRAQEERQLARTCRHGANFRRAPCKRVDEWRQTDAPTRDELAPRGATRWHRAHTTSCDTVVDAGAGCDGKSQPAVSPRGGPRLAAVGTNVAYGRDQRWRTHGATNAMGWLGDRLAVTAAGGVGRAVRTPRRARASRGCTRGGRPENDKSGAGHA